MAVGDKNVIIDQHGLPSEDTESVEGKLIESKIIRSTLFPSIVHVRQANSQPVHLHMLIRLHCPPADTLDRCLPTECPVKTLIRLGR